MKTLMTTLSLVLLCNLAIANTIDYNSIDNPPEKELVYNNTNDYEIFKGELTGFKYQIAAVKAYQKLHLGVKLMKEESLYVTVFNATGDEIYYKKMRNSNGLILKLDLSNEKGDQFTVKIATDNEEYQKSISYRNKPIEVIQQPQMASNE